jgi:hypothetical protein
MKNIITIAVSTLLLGAALSPASAEDQPSTKGPPQTMGDDGKLPATGTVSGAVPEMRGPGAASSPSEAVPDTDAKRMGDSGKLPATGAMSGAVPQMTAPSEPK